MNSINYFFPSGNFVIYNNLLSQSKTFKRMKGNIITDCAILDRRGLAVMEYKDNILKMCKY